MLRIMFLSVYNNNMFVIWTLGGAKGSVRKTISLRYFKNGNEFLNTYYTEYIKYQNTFYLIWH